MTTKQRLALIPAVIILAVLIALALRPTPPPTGYGGIREPSVLVPDSLSVLRYYDAESDVLCWVFTKQFADEHFEVTSSCLPRGATDY